MSDGYLNRAFGFLAGVFLLLGGAGVLAQTEGVLNKLFAPGPLIKGHLNLETKDCLKCHDAGAGVPNERCLDCHKEIKPFVIEKRGLHGLTQKNCIDCHGDHKGRDFDPLRFDEERFDHKVSTGYDLAGKHGKLKCVECHLEKRTKKAIRQSEVSYLGRSATCVSCHRKEDIHYFRGDFAKKDCGSCHSLDSWKEKIQFDHKKDGGFALEGKHEKIKCADCHIVKNTKNVSIYQWPNLKTSQCLSCHENIHKGKLSARYQTGRCNQCHSQEKWSIAQFDHGLTQYKLRGKHAEIECLDCHKQRKPLPAEKSRKNWSWVGLNDKCLSCHQDIHRFGNHLIKGTGLGRDCLSCHNETKWEQTPNFSHDQHTRFKVDGAHESLSCKECHLTKDAKAKPPVWLKLGIYRWSEMDRKTCEVCHDNPHRNEFSKKFLNKKCTDCHSTLDWQTMNQSRSFDHSKTLFPLTGAHKATSCAQCHLKGKKSVYKFESRSKEFCVDCHTNVHQGLFTQKYSDISCSLCHNAEKFTKLESFDHQKTRMALRDAHAKADCNKCHLPGKRKLTLYTPNVRKKDFPKGKEFLHGRYLFGENVQKECLKCHSEVHGKQLGSDCLKCHTEIRWEIASFNHNQLTQYELKSKHQEVGCKECHPPFKDRKVMEMGKEITVIHYSGISTNCLGCHKDVHKGSFGNRCEDCHSERGWKVTKDFHKNFSLTGIHYSLNCNECHREGRKLAGLSQQCDTCHKKDDVHFGTLPLCQDCHRQQFWEVTGFRHSLTQFPLRGVHRTLDCTACHVRGVYQGLSNECVSCHLSDAQAVTSPVHGATMMDCTQCHHNHFTFKSAN